MLSLDGGPHSPGPTLSPAPLPHQMPPSLSAAAMHAMAAGMVHMRNPYMAPEAQHAMHMMHAAAMAQHHHAHAAQQQHHHQHQHHMGMGMAGPHGGMGGKAGRSH